MPSLRTVCCHLSPVSHGGLGSVGLPLCLVPARRSSLEPEDNITICVSAVNDPEITLTNAALATERCSTALLRLCHRLHTLEGALAEADTDTRNTRRRYQTPPSEAGPPRRASISTKPGAPRSSVSKIQWSPSIRSWRLFAQRRQ